MRAVYPWYRRARVALSPRPRLRWVKLEVTSVCNLRCTMCPSHLGTGPRGIMDLDVAEDALRQLPEDALETVMLVSLGEPFLHPGLARIVRAAQDRRPADLFIATNGLLLDDDTVAEVLRSGPLHFHFSAEGYDAATYESIRVGGRFDTFVANLERFRAIRDRVSPETGLHLAYTLVRPHSQEEIRTVQATFGHLVDRVEFRVLHNSSHPEVTYRPDERIMGAVCFGSRPLPCISLWCGLTVNWDGSVSLCPRDHGREFVVGSVDGSLDAAWSGPAARRLRSDHVRGAFPETCRGCADLYMRPLGQLEVERRLAAVATGPDPDGRGRRTNPTSQETPDGR